jgi:hypothetical protein
MEHTRFCIQRSIVDNILAPLAGSDARPTPPDANDGEDGGSGSAGSDIGSLDEIPAAAGEGLPRPVPASVLCFLKAAQGAAPAAEGVVPWPSIPTADHTHFFEFNCDSFVVYLASVVRAGLSYSQIEEIGRRINDVMPHIGWCYKYFSRYETSDMVRSLVGVYYEMILPYSRQHGRFRLRSMAVMRAAEQVSWMCAFEYALTAISATFMSPSFRCAARIFACTCTALSTRCFLHLTRFTARRSLVFRRTARRR